MSRHKVALIIDGPDPDNYLALLAALSPIMSYDLVAVIMTGRPVSRDMSAPPFAFNAQASRAVRRDNALHAKGIVSRHSSRNVPVFNGGRAPFSTVPHHLHIHERVTDVYDDAHAGYELAGGIDDAVLHLARFELVHIICGGPMTDLVYLMRQPLLHGKLGIVTAQLGMFAINPQVTTIAGGRKQFNVLADPGAANEALLYYPRPFYLASTDTTKDPALAINSPKDAAKKFGTSAAAKELADMYTRAWPEMWGGRNIPAHAHDFHPAELMHSLLSQQPFHHTSPTSTGRCQIDRYKVSPVTIAQAAHREEDVDRWGEIDLGTPPFKQAQRFLVDGCDYSQQWGIVRAVLDALPSSR